jgi:hypothetical protein
VKPGVHLSESLETSPFQPSRSWRRPDSIISGLSIGLVLGSDELYRTLERLRLDLELRLLRFTLVRLCFSLGGRILLVVA